MIKVPDPAGVCRIYLRTSFAQGVAEGLFLLGRRVRIFEGDIAFVLVNKPLAFAGRFAFRISTSFFV
jgi:hypothetical protein